MVELVCPVRGCGLALEAGAREARCPRGHLFDRARSGYLNLLQPQDRRSPRAGDAREVVQARARALERGLGEPLLEALVARAAASDLPAGGAALDVGCGDGWFIDRIGPRLGLEAWGVDLSREAVEAAARHHPDVRFLVANADRRLPFADGAFALLISITGPKNGPEFRRLLGARGRLLLAVPGPDDLAELREALFGRVLCRERAGSAVARLAADFVLEDRRPVRHQVVLERAALDDLLTAAYQAARRRVRPRRAALGRLAVTSSYELLCFRCLAPFAARDAGPEPR